MVKRSLFPDGVPVIGGDFRFESEARIRDYQLLSSYAFQTGIVDGFNVSVNPSNRTQLIVGSGCGFLGDVDYSGRENSNFGVFVSLSTPTTILDPPPGGWEPGVPYYVCAVYNKHYLVRPNVDGLSLSNVREIIDECILEIIKVSDYLALSDFEKHNRLKIAKIVPSNPSNLEDSDILNCWKIERIKTSNQPSLITGVMIRNISSVTKDGQGILRWDFSAKSLSWQAPDDSEGTPKVILEDGIYVLESNNINYKLTVYVVVGLLPNTDQTEILEITDLFEPVIRPASGADRLLRSYGGSALKTRNNPLGLSINDLGAGLMDLSMHRRVQHGSGIQALTSGSFCLKTSIISVPGGEDYLQINVPTGSDRYYLMGKEFDRINGSARPYSPSLLNTIMFDDFSGSDYMNVFEVYLDEYGIINKSQRMTCLSLLTNQISGVVPLKMKIKSDLKDTIKTISYGYINNDTRFLSFDNGKEVYLFKDVNMVYTLVGANGVDFVEVWVSWNDLPNVNKSDNWKIVNPSLNSDYALVLCDVAYYKGNIYGYGSAWETGGGEPLDERSFGTVDLKNLGKSVLDYIYSLIGDIVNNGILTGINLSGEGTSKLTISSGEIFIRGKRIFVEQQEITVSGSGNYFIFLDEQGDAYLYNQSGMNNQAWSELCKMMVYLGVVVVSGGNITNIYDQRANPGIGYLRNGFYDKRMLPKIDAGLTLSSKGVDLDNSRIYNINGSIYIVQNLVYNWSDNKWYLDNPSKSGFAFKVNSILGNDLDNYSISDLLYLPANSPGSSSLVPFIKTFFDYDTLKISIGRQDSGSDLGGNFRTVSFMRDEFYKDIQQPTFKFSQLSILYVSEATPTGTSYLDWNKTSKQLRWKAPGDTYGSAVVISPSGGEYTLYSNNNNYFIRVKVDGDMTDESSDTLDLSVSSVNYSLLRARGYGWGIFENFFLYLVADGFVLNKNFSLGYNYIDTGIAWNFPDKDMSFAMVSIENPSGGVNGDRIIYLGVCRLKGDEPIKLAFYATANNLEASVRWTLFKLKIK